MRLFDVNVFLHAHRVDAPHHDRMKDFVESCLGGDDVIGYTPLALSGFLRVVTHPKIFNPPTNIDIAVEFCDSITATPGIVSVTPSDSHWTIYRHLIRASGASGNLIPDAWFAALAIDHGCTWVTTDRDYTRFPGLRVEFPLAM